jgi:hypothetical protein
MKRASVIGKTMVLLLGLVASMGCGISATSLMATQEPVIRTAAVEEARQTAEVEIANAVPATLTAVAATQKVALMSFHGRYVTASGGGGGWLLRQEPELSNCGWFTLHFLDDGKVTLRTCHDRYVTAPESGTNRADWLLWQEIELDDCGQFVLHQSSDGVAFETCAGRFFTAGDGNWEGGLAWSVVGETDTVLAWEWFTLLRR